MRILAVSRSLPWPLDHGGRIRNYHLLKELSARHEVTLLALADRKPSPEAIEQVQKFCRTVEVFPSSRGAFRKGADLFRSLCSKRPYTVLAAGSPELSARFQELLRTGRFDLVQVHELYTAQSLFPLPTKLPVVLDAHNREGLLLDRAASHETNPVRRWFYHHQASKMEWFEQYVIDRVDGVTAVSEAEREYFTQFHERVISLPNGVESVSDRWSPAPGTILFTGELRYPPNRQGLQWFLNEIWPDFKRRHPDAVLQVVSRAPGSALLKHASSSVHFIRDADEIGPYFERAQALIVPLRAGAGTRIKILQALAAGTPVVTTSIGAEGLGASPGEHLLVADSAAEFEEALDSVCSNQQRATALSEAGKDFVRENYLWKEIVERVIGWYERVAG